MRPFEREAKYGALLKSLVKAACANLSAADIKARPQIAAEPSRSRHAGRRNAARVGGALRTAGAARAAAQEVESAVVAVRNQKVKDEKDAATKKKAAADKASKDKRQLKVRPPALRPLARRGGGALGLEAPGAWAEGLAVRRWTMTWTTRFTLLAVPEDGTTTMAMISCEVGLC